MCGICGEIHFDKTIIPEDYKYQLLDSIKYRGPDNSGIYSNKSLFLGHSRLSIIDISEKSNQPMIDNELELTIIFNGVIYNYRELRKELIDKGYNFTSEGDTEVILKAYHQYGIEFLKKLDGVFSFCIHDRKSKKLILSRDRFGIKPLYYLKKNNYFIFSSTMKSLIDRSNKEINDIALNYHFSLHSVVPAPHTIFKDIYKLEQGHYLEISEDGKFSKNNFYTTHDININRDISEGEIIDETERLLIKAIIKRQTISDVPVGVLLSGGLDSSLIVAMAAMHTNKDINTYSIGFTDRDNEKGNEFYYSDNISKRFSTNHSKILTNDDELYNNLDNVIDMMPEPLSSQDAAGFYLLAKHVSRNQKVVLSGQGADELFGGYFWYKKMNEESGNDIEKFTKHYIDRSFKDFSLIIDKKHVNDEYSSKIVTEWFKAYERKDIGFLDKLLRIDISNLIIDDPVKRVDSMTMAWALETRVPFLDQELVEFLLSIPSEMKINNYGKYFLKKVSEKYLSTELINRKKFYFPVPPLKILKGKFLNFVIDTLTSQSSINRGIYNHNQIKNLLKKPNSHYTKLEGNTLWHLALFERWLSKVI